MTAQIDQPLFDLPDVPARVEPQWPRVFRIDWRPGNHPGAPFLPVAYGIELPDGVSTITWTHTGNTEVIHGGVRPVLAARRDPHLSIVYMKEPGCAAVTTGVPMRPGVSGSTG